MRQVVCKACAKESCFLELKCKVGGRVRPSLSICLRPIENKYHEGTVKRTLRRKLKVPETVEKEAAGLEVVK